MKAKTREESLRKVLHEVDEGQNEVRISEKSPS
jgi:hypothetical protein